MPQASTQNSLCPDFCCGCQIQRPLIGLDGWADCLCFALGSRHRWHFWQIAQPVSGALPLVAGDPSPTPIIPYDIFNACADLIYNGAAFGSESISGRNEIYRAIKSASYIFQQRYKDQTGHYPWETQDCYEFNPYSGGINGVNSYYYPQAYQPFTYPSHRDGLGRGDNCTYKIQLPCEYLTGFGTESDDFVQNQAMPAEYLFDDDGDGLIDTVRFDVVIDGNWQSVDELRVFFIEDDRTQFSDIYRDEIRPIRVTCNEDNTVFTVEFPSRLAVKPSVYAARCDAHIDPNDRTAYANFFQLNRHWFDESRAVTIMRRTNIGCGCECYCQNEGEVDADSGCYACVQGKVCSFNSKLGMIEIQLDDDGASCCSCCPMCVDRVCINYRSGKCSDPDMMCYIIARFAASLLRQKICCRNHDCLEDAQADYVGVSEGPFGPKVISTLSDAEKLLTGVFGTRRGGIEAMRFVMLHMHEKRYVSLI